jgi:hypothetical protein
MVSALFIVATDKLYAEGAVAIDQSTLDTIALSRTEYDLIVQKLRTSTSCALTSS